ncbi:hypothetical protein, partial [Erwinia amylovora]
AMVASLQFLSLLGGVRLRHDRITSVVRPRDIYDWARDFPVSLQARNPDGETVFDMEFRLSGEEIEQFRTDVKSNLNG